MPRFAWCLVAVAAALLLVGIVSSTPLRHLVQLAPAVAVALLARRRVPWAADAALPVCAVWLLLMTLIWLYLLGVARVITGHFPPVEIALTIVIGAASLAGLVAAARASRARPAVRAAAVLGFAALQVATLWLSMRMPIARM